MRGGRTVTATYLIFTAPVNMLKGGDIEFRPALPRDKREALDGVIMPDGLKLFMRFNRRFYPDIVAFKDGEIPTVSERIYYNVALDKPSRQHILGMFAYGALATPWTRLSDRQIRDRALAELDMLYDGAASRGFEAYRVQNWSKSPWHKGAYSTFINARPSDLGKPIEGRIFFAGEAYNRRWNGNWGYMHTAALSLIHI